MLVNGKQLKPLRARWISSVDTLTSSLCLADLTASIQPAKCWVNSFLNHASNLSKWDEGVVLKWCNKRVWNILDLSWWLDIEKFMKHIISLSHPIWTSFNCKLLLWECNTPRSCRFFDTIFPCLEAWMKRTTAAPMAQKRKWSLSKMVFQIERWSKALVHHEIILARDGWHVTSGYVCRCGLRWEQFLIVVGTSVGCYGCYGRVVAQSRNQPLKDVTMCLGVGYCAVAPWWGLRWSSHANPSWLHVGPVEIRAIQSAVDTPSTSRRENNVQCLHHFTATSSFFCQKLQPLLTVL